MLRQLKKAYFKWAYDILKNIIWRRNKVVSLEQILKTFEVTISFTNKLSLILLEAPLSSRILKFISLHGISLNFFMFNLVAFIQFLL